MCVSVCVCVCVCVCERERERERERDLKLEKSHAIKCTGSLNICCRNSAVYSIIYIYIYICWRKFIPKAIHMNIKSQRLINHNVPFVNNL